VRLHWNNAALRQWCASSGHQIFICTAEDSLSAKKSSKSAHIIPKDDNHNDKQLRTLPRTIEIAVGMKVMITENLETDLDITNGAQGHICGIALHQNEPPLDDNVVVHLKHLPMFVLVKLDRTRASPLPGLEDGVIPIEPREIGMKFTVQDNGEISHRAGYRRQYPFTAAYAFTDYRSQGRTLSHVIVDMARPPRSTLTLFNLYVALSRSSGRSTIQLLRDFDEDLLWQKHNAFLLAEDKRINDLDEETQTWWTGTNV
jgi:ATP-dependent exoDNAse (exonuclease V) alpha subunit